MSVEIAGDLGGFLDDLIVATEIGARMGLYMAARRYYNAIMQAFEQEGPGWRPLHEFTIMKKILRGSQTPERILREFGTMRESIEIRDDVTRQEMPLFGDVIADVFGFVPSPGGGLDFQRVGVIRDILGWYVVSEYSYSVGLFDDNYHARSARMVSGFPGTDDPERFRVVNRGIMHEYGGIELQSTTGATIEEVRTSGLKRKALRGEQVIEKFPKKTKKKTLGRDIRTTWLMKIPKRSFMIDPYDRVESLLMMEIVISMAAMLRRV